MQFLTANMTSMGNSEFALIIFGALAQEESAGTSKRNCQWSRMPASEEYVVFRGSSVSAGKAYLPSRRHTFFHAVQVRARLRADAKRARRHGSGACVKGNMEERAVSLAQYIIENRATVRGAAQKFGISKSTVHMDT